MTLWRISDHRSLDGTGGLFTPGRWHTRGRRIVYCAPNPATSLVEVLVHIEVDSGDLPDTLQYLEIEAPDQVSTESVEIDGLGRNWRTDVEATQRAGDQWLGANRTALFRVPSAIVPETWNFLLNPRHPESSRVRVRGVRSYMIDPRLLR